MSTSKADLRKQIKANGVAAAKKIHAEFKKLPKKDRDLACTCDKKDYVPYSTKLKKPMSYGKDYPYGFYCTNCDKAYMYSVFLIIKNRKVYKNL